MAHAERAALADDLADLNESQWAQQSLCGQWTVEAVVAHLTAGASNGRLRWLVRVVSARFDFEKHNDRQLAGHVAPPRPRLGAIPSSRHQHHCGVRAYSGMARGGGRPRRRPLWMLREPSIEAATEVAHFYASRDFTVPSRSMIEGLRLEATDGPFAIEQALWSAERQSP
ncbi:maleylpyruvate isomerase N-terminal domain-containing protein [Nocardia sp. NPDC004604]|uniref:maleylpyruvate isomerase N-terminal domain-containing protein n=1 Tax=Nocardia sp. NPDC004604 TaxID=3157013 RepID=UPI0033AAF660